MMSRISLCRTRVNLTKRVGGRTNLLRTLSTVRLITLIDLIVDYEVTKRGETRT